MTMLKNMVALKHFSLDHFNLLKIKILWKIVFKVENLC